MFDVGKLTQQVASLVELSVQPSQPPPSSNGPILQFDLCEGDHSGQYPSASSVAHNVQTNSEVEGNQSGQHPSVSSDANNVDTHSDVEVIEIPNNQLPNTAREDSRKNIKFRAPRPPKISMNPWLTRPVWQSGATMSFGGQTVGRGDNWYKNNGSNSHFRKIRKINVGQTSSSEPSLSEIQHRS